MKCEICGVHEATIHLTEVVDDEIRKIHLCAECAAQKGVTAESGFGLADLLLGVSGSRRKAAGAVCPRCGMTEEDFRRGGRLGCAECYEVFAESVAVLVKGMHHGDRHVGKVPPQYGELRKRRRLESLKRRLDGLVQAEAYEEAARVRDEIRLLEGEIESAGGGNVVDRSAGA